ncbi:MULTISPECIES: roadblock/LC7 domain-containing protein [Streptomyces]|uniref:Roadblock/LC7 domain-containing protein n=1 Tax=Streptomyces eurythermus TaxID=42237 RepID=A0ABW6Z3L6_9ACTN|nr:MULTISPECIES: roadblock/LC7 domain-containing protein [Streptomyces]QIS75155.1 roadblock/LC7 domain-containing protein [Streptomyces sp. DSM 40868]
MPNDHHSIDWLLQDFLDKSKGSGVMAVVLTSSDGLLIASRNIEDNAATGNADILSALSSGVHSLAKGASRQLGAGPVAQTLIEMGEAHLYIRAAGDGAILAVMGQPDADPGQIIFEMSLLVGQMPQNLSVPERLAPAAARTRG